MREATAEKSLRYLRAPSLPGSYAPKEAGCIIAECILDALSRVSDGGDGTDGMEGGGSP